MEWLNRLAHKKSQAATGSAVDEFDFKRGAVTVKDLFLPDALEETKDMLYLGPSRYARIYALSVYPRDVYVGWLDDLFSAGEIDISVLVEVIPDSVVIKKLNEQVVKTEAMYTLQEKRGNILQLPQLKEMLEDLEAERTAIQTNRDKMFYVTVLIAVYGKTPEEVEVRSADISDILARKATHMRCLSFRQVEALKAVLPINAQPPRGFRRNVTTGGLISFFPIANPDLSHPSGIYLGRNLFTGAPVFLDSFIGPPWLNNQHITVFGIPGAGKSVCIKTILNKSVLRGTYVAILDREGEYKRMVTELLGGQYITIRQGRPAGINPLDIEPDMDEAGNRQYVPIMDKVAEMRALLGTIAQNFMGRPLTAREIVAIEQAVPEIYAERGIDTRVENLYTSGGIRLDDGSYAISGVKKSMPTLSDLQRALASKPNSAELAEVLKPFLRGGSMGFFDCENTVDPKSQVICFDLSMITDEFTKLYSSFVLLTWIWQKFVQKNRDKKKIVAVDEAWTFIKYKESAEFLETLARRGRKHRACLLIGSQFIDEFLSSEQGRAVINSADTSILMRQNPAVVDQVVEYFHLAGGARDLLSTFQPGEAILSLNRNVTGIRVEPIPYEWEYIKT